MIERGFRWLSLELLAIASMGLLTLTGTMNSALAYGDTLPLPLGSSEVPPVTELMGASGLPIPSLDPSYVSAATAYVHADLPGTKPVQLFTPEGLFPLTGTESLSLDQSVSQGITILNDTIRPQLAADTPVPVGVLGISQSADIASLEMEQLDPAGSPSSLPAYFVLVGDEMNPNGGLLERFAGLNLAALGINFSGATPANDFSTAIYSNEYDGFADYCQYPIDFVCDLNADLGIAYDDSYTSPGTASIQLPTEGATETTYYMSPTTDLPLLEPLRAIPVVGNPIADLLQPDLTYIVNLGYGDPLYGWSTSAANVPTPFGLFPTLHDIEQLPGLLVSGTEQGIQHFIGDFTGTGPNPVTLSSALADPLTALSAFASDPTLSLTNIVNTLSGAASTAYSTLLGTADFANSLLTSLPAYDLSLFLGNLSNPIAAIGLPIAADTGLVTLIGGFEVVYLGVEAASVLSSLSGLIP